MLSNTNSQNLRIFEQIRKVRKHLQKSLEEGRDFNLILAMKTKYVEQFSICISFLTFLYFSPLPSLLFLAVSFFFVLPSFLPILIFFHLLFPSYSILPHYASLHHRLHSTFPPSLSLTAPFNNSCRVMTDGMKYCLATGNWGDRKNPSKAGVVQVPHTTSNHKTYHKYQAISHHPTSHLTSLHNTIPHHITSHHYAP